MTNNQIALEKVRAHIDSPGGRKTFADLDEGTQQEHYPENEDRYKFPIHESPSLWQRMKSCLSVSAASAAAHSGNNNPASPANYGAVENIAGVPPGTGKNEQGDDEKKPSNAPVGTAKLSASQPWYHRLPCVGQPNTTGDESEKQRLMRHHG